MNTAMHTYNGYKITVRLAPDGMSGQVDVFDPRFPRDPSLYRTTSLDRAMRWVDAYIKGEQWADLARQGIPRQVLKPMTPKQYRAALDRLDLTQVGAARLFGANERTSRYWANGERGIPSCVAIVLKLLVAGKITTADVEAVR